MKKVNLTLREMLEFNQSIEYVQKQNFGHIKFKYFLSKNGKILKQELSSLEDVRKNVIAIRKDFDEELMQAGKIKNEYDNQWRDFILEKAEKDERGNPVMIGNGNVKLKEINGVSPSEINKSISDFQMKLEDKFKDELEQYREKEKELKDKYKNVLAEFKEKELEFEELIKEKKEIELMTINLEHIPSEINFQVMDMLVDFDLINE